MSYQTFARAVGGILTVIVLLSVTVASVIDPNIALHGEIIVMLVGLLSALLGVEVAKDVLPLRITISNGVEVEDSRENDSSGGNEQEGE